MLLVLTLVRTHVTVGSVRPHRRAVLSFIYAFGADFCFPGLFAPNSMCNETCLII
jgi:hypothetical protein